MTTRKKRTRTKEPDWDKTRQGWVGKGKIQALRVEQLESGRYRLHYNNEKGDLEYIDADSREEMDKLLIEFGGKNPDTVSAPDEFLVIDGSWGSKDLSNLGHIIQKISVRGCHNRSTSIPVLLPKKCGVEQIINKKKGVSKPLQMNRRMRGSEEIVKTLNFPEPEEFDNLVKEMVSNQYLRDLSWSVTEMVTASKGTKKSCKWKRSLAGDGSKRMTLQLTHLDGMPYTKCVRQDLFDAADDMFDTPCTKIPDARKKQDGSMVCYWAGKSGQLKDIAA